MMTNPENTLVFNDAMQLVAVAVKSLACTSIIVISPRDSPDENAHLVNRIGKKNVSPYWVEDIVEEF